MSLPEGLCELEDYLSSVQRNDLWKPVVEMVVLILVVLDSYQPFWA